MGKSRLRRAVRLVIRMSCQCVIQRSLVHEQAEIYRNISIVFFLLSCGHNLGSVVDRGSDTLGHIAVQGDLEAEFLLERGDLNPSITCESLWAIASASGS